MSHVPDNAFEEPDFDFDAITEKVYVGDFDSSQRSEPLTQFDFVLIRSQQTSSMDDAVADIN